MRLPVSPKILLRLHRKLFMLRRPTCSLTLTPGKKAPTVTLRVTKHRSPIWGALLLLTLLLFAAYHAARGE